MKNGNGTGNIYKKITFKEITDLWFESYKKKEELRKVMELFN